MGEGDGFNVGKFQHLPPTVMVSHTLPYPAELASLASLKAWGERKYGLLTIWVNPCQARVHSMEEAVRNLTAWVSSGPDWPYALVWLHKDTCHTPLPKGDT